MAGMSKVRIVIRLLTVLGLVVSICAEVRIFQLQRQMDVNQKKMADYEAKRAAGWRWRNGALSPPDTLPDLQSNVVVLDSKIGGKRFKPPDTIRTYGHWDRPQDSIDYGKMMNPTQKRKK